MLDQEINLNDFDSIYRSEYSYIYKFCLKILKSVHDAEDITQTTFIWVFRKIHMFDPEGGYSFRSWLRAIAFNAMRFHWDWMKRRELKNFISFDEVDEEVLVPFIHYPRPNQLDVEDRMMIHKALSKVKPKYREAMILTNIYGFEASDIAKHLGVPSGTIGNRAKRGRDRMVQLTGYQYHTPKQKIIIHMDRNGNPRCGISMKTDRLPNLTPDRRKVNCSRCIYFGRNDHLPM